MPLKIFWTPDGITLDSIRDKRLVDISDGDTPNIRMNVRMLSIDTPEKRPTGKIRNKDELQAMFQEVATWIETGDSPVNANLAAHLVPRLKRIDAVANHLAQGAQATAAHEALVDTKLRRPNRLGPAAVCACGRSAVRPIRSPAGLCRPQLHSQRTPHNDPSPARHLQLSDDRKRLGRTLHPVPLDPRRKGFANGARGRT